MNVPHCIIKWFVRTRIKGHNVYEWEPTTVDGCALMVQCLNAHGWGQCPSKFLVLIDDLNVV